MRLYLAHPTPLGVHQTVGSQDPMRLRDNQRRVKDMLEHSLEHRTIKALVSEQEIVPVAHDAHMRREVDIGSDDLDCSPGCRSLPPRTG